MAHCQALVAIVGLGKKKTKSSNNNKDKRLPSLIKSKCTVMAVRFEFQRQTGDDTRPLQIHEGGVFGKQVKGQVG